jgi:hypothetical protein
MITSTERTEKTVRPPNHMSVQIHVHACVAVSCMAQLSSVRRSGKRTESST